MSISGLVSQDLSTSNLVVSKSLTSSQVTTLRLDAEAINGQQVVSRILPIYSSFSGQQIGTLNVINQTQTLSLISEINEDNVLPLPAYTAFAVVPDWQVQNDIYFNGLMYDPLAATIATAATNMTVIISASGEVSSTIPVPPKVIVVYSNEGPVALDPKRRGPCAAGNCVCQETDRWGRRYGPTFCCKCYIPLLVPHNLE